MMKFAKLRKRAAERLGRRMLEIGVVPPDDAELDKMVRLVLGTVADSCYQGRGGEALKGVADAARANGVSSLCVGDTLAAIAEADAEPIL